MRLKNQILRKLAESKIIEWKNDYFNNEEKQKYEEQQKDFRRLEFGEEIEPPWVKYSDTLTPYELKHDYWLNNIWLVFWRKMDSGARESYREKWSMSDEWYEFVTMFWTNEEDNASKLQ